MARNDSGERHADGNKTIIDSGEHIADVSKMIIDSDEHVANVNKMVSPNTALRAVAADFMQTMAACFADTCRKFGISEETAGALLTGTLLLDEPKNAEAFEVAWSDVYDGVVARTEAEHGVKVEADCYYVEVLETATGDSVVCEWGDSLADNGSNK